METRVGMGDDKRDRVVCQGCQVYIVRSGSAAEAVSEECYKGRVLEKETLADAAGNRFRVEFFICCNCRDGRNRRLHEEEERRCRYLSSVPQARAVEEVCHHCEVRAAASAARERQECVAKLLAAETDRAVKVEAQQVEEERCEVEAKIAAVDAERSRRAEAICRHQKDIEAQV